MKTYDYIIVGSGLFGAVFAHILNKSGKKCLIIEKRNNIGGNVRTENIEGVNVHMYGPHIFHCNDQRIWDFVNQFAEFNNYVNRPKVFYDNKIYSFPINLFTLYQLWGVNNPSDANKKLDSVKIKIDNPSNLEEWILSQVGEEIYQKFIYGYTKKQWGKEPKHLPSSIIKRLPIRMNYDDNYFTDKYQGIPVGGYTKMMERIIGDIPCENGIDYNLDQDFWNKKANKIVYTGMIDEFYKYCYGNLEYRSLNFKSEVLDMEDYQGNALINYTDYNVPYTRICEHKHFEFVKSSKTVITKEYPEKWDRGKDAYYPINDEKNNLIFKKYKELNEENKNIIMGGRLSDYKYYDMHQVIGSAIVRANGELNE